MVLSQHDDDDDDYDGKVGRDLLFQWALGIRQSFSRARPPRLLIRAGIMLFLHVF